MGDGGRCAPPVPRCCDVEVDIESPNLARRGIDVERDVDMLELAVVDVLVLMLEPGRTEPFLVACADPGTGTY